MGMLFGGPKISPPPPPPPPPNPPSAASPSVAEAMASRQAATMAAAGAGFDNTLLTGGQGAPRPASDQKQLTGQ